VHYSVAREKIRQAKQDKFAAKQAKSDAQKPAVDRSSRSKAESGVSTLPRYTDDTPLGQKKTLRSFDDPHFRAYSPSAVEATWYSWWEQSGFFKPRFAANGRTLERGQFVVPLPPPNVTGALHCGHALANSLQDILVRWHRMR
jgi:valyl-tRNA synthetase